MSALTSIARLLACLLLVVTASLVVVTQAQAETIEIKLEGAGELPEDQLLAALSLSRYEAGENPNRDHLRVLVERGEGELKKTLEALGHYRAKVDGEVVGNDDEDNNELAALYKIRLGPPVLITTNDTRIMGPGSSDKELRDLLASFELEPGTPLRHAAYEDAKRRLLSRALDIGYLDAAIENHELVIDLDSYSAAVKLSLRTGELYHFGPVSFTQDIITESILHRYLPFAEGDRYRTRDLGKLRRNLLDSGYFAEVKVVSTRSTAPPTVAIATELTPRPNHRFEIGVGYGTDTGARTNFGWEWRRVNKRAHRMRTELQVSEIGHDASVRYAIPLKEGITEQYVLTANQTVEDVDTSYFRRNRVGVSRDSFKLNWLISVGADFESENYEVADESDSAQLFMPFISLQRTWSNDPILPTLGYSLFGRAHFAEETFASSVSFSQVRGSIKTVLSPIHGHRFLLRAEGGFTDIETAEDLPVSQRFFAGGDYSVRGYAYHSLGPENADGDVVGGRYLAVASAEYEYAFNSRWAGAIFVDAGNAYDELAVAEAMEGAGVGVRWRLPFGALRFDIAKALSLNGNIYRGHLTLGVDL